MTNSGIWPQDRPEYDSLAAAVQGETARWNVPGISAAVYANGQIETATAGFANLQTKAPVTDQTLFQIGSITKLYTATLAEVLADAGKLDLDIPVREYLPDFKLKNERTAEKITIRQLLSHQAGFEGDQFEDMGLGDDALAKAVAKSDGWNNWVELNELWFYNNAGFYVAGRAIETVTEKTFEAAMKEYVLDPLGVKDTVLFTEDVIVRPHAVGHTLISRKEGYKIAEPFPIPRHACAAGYITAPAIELLKFGQMHLGEGTIDGTTVLSRERALEMRKPLIKAGNFADDYATGFAIEYWGDATIIQHGGSTNGQQAHLDLIPETDFAIAMLTNGSIGTTAYYEIREWAFKHYRNVTKPKPEVIKLSAKDLEKRAGVYTRSNAQIEVKVEDDGLVATLSMVSPLTKKPAGETDEVRMKPVSDGTYVSVSSELAALTWDFIDLTPDANGKDRHFLRMGGRLTERGRDEESAESGRKGSRKAAAKPKKSKK